MGSLFNAFSDLRSGARYAADVTIWAGHMGSRYLNAGRRGFCLVCNNLQPYGHEDTFGRVGARLLSNTPDEGPSAHLSSLRKASGPGTLVLTDISPKKLLETRQKDKTAGLPKNNCRYCRFLCDVFDAFFVDEYMSWITETQNGMPISVGLMIREGQPLIVNCANFTYDKYNWRPRVDLEIYTNLNATQIGQTGGLPCMGPVGPRAENAKSESCKRFVKECVQQCTTQHQSCAIRPTTFMPTRLIYLGTTNEELKICDPISAIEEVKWAALSHCWGGHQPLKLEQVNLSSFKRRVEFSDLPATFRDAIGIARELGLYYLWIDSLCIVQDNKADWETEAARMGMVYSQAFIVLCAASSSNPQTPFIGKRDDDWLPKTFEFEPHSNVKVPITVRKRHLLAPPLEQSPYDPPFTSSWATLKRIGPLYQRGWCFQETFLATRVLHFTPGAIIFECRTHRRSEDQLPPFPLTSPGTLGEVSDAEKWRMIVKLYTQRQLTFASDKLPAIAGAASSMPQASRSLYLAGLWCESLLLDLLWQVMPGGTHTALTYKETDSQNAPSWSWASLSHGIVWTRLQDPKLLADIVEAEAAAIGANPYGEVSGGRVLVRGRILPCHVSTFRHKNEQWIHYTHKDGSTSKRQHFRADGQLMAENMPGNGERSARRAHGGEWEMEVHAEAFCLCVAKTPWMNYNYVGLVLGRSTRQFGCLERVGMATNLPRDWYDAGEMATVTIV